MSSATRPAGPYPAPRTPRAERPRRGELARAADRGRRARRRRGRAAWTATSCSSTARFPASWCAPRSCASKRDYANARAVEVLEPSPDRVPQRCDHEGQRVPGLALAGAALRAPARAQAGAGRRRADAARRPGRASSWSRSSPTADPWRYRNKMEYSFGDVRRMERWRSASTRRGRWDAVDDARDCMLASERSNAVRNLVRDWCAAQGLSAIDRRTREGLPAQPGRARGTPHAATCSCGSSRQPATSSRGALRGASRARFPAPTCCGPAPTGWPRSRRAATPRSWPGSSGLHEELCGLRFRISPEAFFQTNTEMAERLYGLARDYAALDGRERVLRPLLRHRDAQPGAGAARRRGLGRRHRRRRRSPTRSRTRA